MVSRCSKYHVWPTKVIQKLGRRNKPNSMAEHHPNLWNFAVNRRKHTENSQNINYLFMLVKILEKSQSLSEAIPCCNLLWSAVVFVSWAVNTPVHPVHGNMIFHDPGFTRWKSWVENRKPAICSEMSFRKGEINLALPKNNDLPWLTPSCLSISVEKNEAFRKIINFWGAIHSKPPLGSPAL